MPVTIVRKNKKSTVTKPVTKRAEAVKTKAKVKKVKADKPKTEPKKAASGKRYDPDAKKREKLKSTAVRVNMESIDKKFDFEVFDERVVLELASVNDKGIKVYTAYHKGMYIGRLESAGGEHVACKTLVPENYGELVGAARITPTGHSLKDGCYLLLKHGGLLPPNNKLQVKTG